MSAEQAKEAYEALDAVMLSLSDLYQGNTEPIDAEPLLVDAVDRLLGLIRNLSLIHI